MNNPYSDNLTQFFQLPLEFCTIQKAVSAFNCRIEDIFVLASTKKIKLTLQIPHVSINLNLNKIKQLNPNFATVHIPQETQETIKTAEKEQENDVFAEFINNHKFGIVDISGMWAIGSKYLVLKSDGSIEVSYVDGEVEISLLHSAGQSITTNLPDNVYLPHHNIFITKPDLEYISNTLVTATKSNIDSTGLKNKVTRTEPKQTEMIKTLIQLIPELTTDVKNSRSKQYDIISTICAQRGIDLPIEKRTFQRWLRDN